MKAAEAVGAGTHISVSGAFGEAAVGCVRPCARVCACVRTEPVPHPVWWPVAVASLAQLRAVLL